MIRRSLLHALAIAAAALLAPLGARAQGTLDGVRFGVSVQPESVTVGDPFVVRVRVTAPAGATIAFPTGPDSAAAVAVVASRTVTPNPGAATDQTAAYTLVAWEVGDVHLGLGDVVVTLGGAQRRVSLSTSAVRVTSVLPADSTLRVPKPPRPPYDIPIPWWKRWWPLLVALAILALLLWWWLRRRKKAAAAAPVDAHAFAEREFSRIEALGLVEAGERGRHVALMVEVLRDYLALRLPAARASLTSSELVRALRGNGAVPAERLAALLDEADLVKFARRPLAPDRARALGRDARAIARDVEGALAKAAAAAPPAPQEAAA